MGSKSGACVVIFLCSLSGIRPSYGQLEEAVQAGSVNDYDDYGAGVTAEDVLTAQPGARVGADNSLPSSRDQQPGTLVFIRDLKNITREVGDSLKLKCEVQGKPPATTFKWFKNEAPLKEESGRVKIKDSVKGGKTQWSVIRFRELETLDKGFYRCEASNKVKTIKSNSVLIVNLGTGGGGKKFNIDEDDVHLPGSFQDPFEALDSLNNGIDGFPAHIEFEGRKPPGHMSGVHSQSFMGGQSMNQAGGAELPTIKPNEKFGKCQKYVGSACSKVVGDSYVFVSTDQHYVEQKLAATFSVITAHSDMSPRCAEFAIPAICHSTFPLCDARTQKPRKLCRDECEVLEQDVCKSELMIAKSHPLIGHQMSLSECDELPPIGTMQSHNCVKLGIPGLGHLIKPHSCFNGVGETYRGTHSMASSGLVCKPWNEQFVLDPLPTNLEIIGGHNYCRNPNGKEQMEEPWCFTNDRTSPKQVCGIPQCSDFNIWLYVVLPAAVALVLAAVIIGL